MNKLKKYIFYSFVLIICLIGISNCSSSDSSSGNEKTFSPTKVNLSSISNLGVFDPALTFDAGINELSMSYSAVDTSLQLESGQRVVSTRLAKSNNKGLTWTDQSVVIGDKLNVNLSYPGLPSLGVWQHEVSNLIFDPSSVNLTDRWKLFSHHYLQVKTTDPGAERRFEHGWISYKKAASPELLASATEVKLFGAAGYNSANDMLNGTTGSPVAGSPVINLQNLNTDLNNCLIFTEPGLLSTSINLYLSLVCVEASNYKIILLGCSQPCSVTSGWFYIRTLLQNNEANDLGYLNFSASELFSYQGDYYLAISPEGTTGAPGIYHGCYIYKFSNLATGVLVSSTTPVKKVEGAIGSFNGACSFNENSTDGFYYSEANPSATDPFQIFRVKVTPFL